MAAVTNLPDGGTIEIKHLVERSVMANSTEVVFPAVYDDATCRNRARHPGELLPASTNQ